MTGQTIPCFDQLGIKPGFSPNRPGLFRDFDQITFYRVGKEELEREMARFRSGCYNFQYEEVMFDMTAHNDLLAQTKEEVAAFKSRQATAQVEMLALEKESMDRWMSEKAQNELPADTISLLKEGKFCHIQIFTIIEVSSLDITRPRYSDYLRSSRCKRVEDQCRRWGDCLRCSAGRDSRGNENGDCHILQ